jgi:hypothetical protein
MSRDHSMSLRNFGGWRCDCGILNDACDATCECDRIAERRESIRRAAIARMGSLSPAERRARLA